MTPYDFPAVRRAKGFWRQKAPRSGRIKEEHGRRTSVLLVTRWGAYVRFKRKIKDVKSEKNDRGKDIKGKTRKDKIMKIINEMNLTNDQKDALYLLAGYAESTIRKAPWR